MEHMQGTSFLQAALRLAKKGFKVFPVRPNAKFPPLIERFPERATTDPEQIQKWWTRWPLANIAISTNGHLVIDVDPKTNGLESLKSLETDLGELPATYRQRTPSGGFHLVFQAEGLEHVTVSQSKLGSGLDIRANGGYILGAGSCVQGSYYREE